MMDILRRIFARLEAFKVKHNTDFHIEDLSDGEDE
jgi:hypothetical protein